MKGSRNNRYWVIFVLASLIVGFFNLFVLGFSSSPKLTVIAGFVAMVVHFGLVALMGGTIGMGVAFLAHNLVQDAIPLATALRLTLWMPVFGMWMVPFVTELGILAVAGVSFYYSVVLKALGIDGQKIKRLVIAETLSHSLLITLLIQVLESGFGWFAVYESFGLVKALSTLLFVVFTHCVVITTIPSNFVETAEVYGNTLEVFVSSNPRSFVKAAILAGAIFVIVWETLSWSGLKALISSPLAVLVVSIRESPFRHHLWRDVVTSFGEICLGIAVSGAIALYLWQWLASRNALQSSAWKLLYLTHITPIVIIPVLVYLGLLKGFWLATACVALLSFFPFFRVLAATTRLPRLKAILGFLEALPYAFVAMLFSETMHSFGGLGFAITAARIDSPNTPASAMAIGVIAVLMMVVMIVVVRWFGRTVAKRARGGYCQTITKNTVR